MCLEQCAGPNSHSFIRCMLYSYSLDISQSDMPRTIGESRQKLFFTDMTHDTFNDDIRRKTHSIICRLRGMTQGTFNDDSWKTNASRHIQSFLCDVAWFNLARHIQSFICDVAWFNLARHIQSLVCDVASFNLARHIQSFVCDVAWLKAHSMMALERYMHQDTFKFDHSYMTWHDSRHRDIPPFICDVAKLTTHSIICMWRGMIQLGKTHSIICMW